ncbi:MAG: FAD-dependent oxidoreductase [Bacteroidota bacterium]
MADKFSPVSIHHLLYLILYQEKKGQIFGVPKELFFTPNETDPFKTSQFGQLLETPIGVAAGPHTQLAQNIVMAWLCGARYIELKTIQTLDQLEVSKPCIDMQDEGYNCEWSQELRIQESFDQYLNSWIILHVLRDKFGYTNKKGGVKRRVSPLLRGGAGLPRSEERAYRGGGAGEIFNMSVGYNMEGVMKENVQWFFDKMNNCKDEKEKKIESLLKLYPDIGNIDIPDRISDNITLSTMHGCPPEEIEKIGLYLIEEKKLHTIIKLNPTLLGAEQLRDILNNKLGFKTQVPDIAFEHDLKYPDAVNIIKSLQDAAQKNNVSFGLKLTNTLESVNNKNVFGKETEMMYMSGRALHPIAINLAKKLQNEFNGQLDISFAGGADCFNVADILACGLKTVTVSSDILKPGGYGRLHQYLTELNKQFNEFGAENIDDFIVKKDGVGNLQIHEAALLNLNKYANDVLENEAYKKIPFYEPNIKTERELKYFDCIKAPCVNTCPGNQDIPEYMYYTSRGEFQKAFEVIMQTNPFPTVLGMVCNHLCQTKCSRINYDNPLMIREIKRFIAEKDHGLILKAESRDSAFKIKPAKNNGIKTAIIGAGPSGLSCAYFLALAGFEVNVYETKSFPGGMISDAIPAFRLTNEAIQKDIKRIENLGIKIHYNSKVDKMLFEELHANNQYVYIATGAQSAMKLNIEGEDAKNVLDALKFLSDLRNNQSVELGNDIVIIGGGNVAIDSARTAIRLNVKKVTMVCLEQRHEMPAYAWEIEEAEKEGIRIMNGWGIVKIVPSQGENNLSKVELKKCISVFNENGDFSPEYDESVTDTVSGHSVIVCIGQQPVLDFIEKDLMETDKETYQTKIKNVYLGGDALRGASSIIDAVADGRKVAQNIIKKSQKDYNEDFIKPDKDLSLTDYRVKRAKREYGILPVKTDIDDRKYFDIIVPALTEEQAVNEASRCLCCNDICNICETVCPNRANYSYITEPIEYHLRKAIKKGNQVVIEDDEIFKVEQKFQILNISDFCNECGNCTTFCPTNGSPFKDKPNFYLTQKSFNEAENGYFIIKSGKKIILLFKDGKNTSSLTLDDNIYLFENEDVATRFNKKDFRITDIEFMNPGIREYSFKMATEMSILLEGAKDLYV